jgi:hypothetical protein
MKCEKIYKSNVGFIVFCFGILVLIFVAYSEYINKQISPFAYLAAAIILFIGLYIITRSHGTTFIFDNFENDIKLSFLKKSPIYFPDNNQIAHAICYTKKFFSHTLDSCSKEVSFYCGHMEPLFYRAILVNAQEAVKRNIDIRILIENNPSEKELAVEYENNGIKVKKLIHGTKNKPPHFIVSPSAYRVEEESHSEGAFQTTSCKTKGFFAFGVAEKNTAMIRKKFDYMWKNQSEEIDFESALQKKNEAVG